MIFEDFRVLKVVPREYEGSKNYSVNRNSQLGAINEIFIVFNRYRFFPTY